jgi:hypothetical protein
MLGQAPVPSRRRPRRPGTIHKENGLLGVANHGVVSQFAGGRKPFSSVSFSWAPEQMGWAYFPAYWAYITVQLVFIRPDPTVRSQ